MNYKDLKIIADSIRVLSMDAVQKAKSGHPGMPLGCADIAAVLWGKILKHNPADPTWINRDRFILSAGHGSMLLYSALHLSGYDVSLDDIKNFRQLGSKTPGHPEYCCTSSVEVTSGPLGQGFANAVGMAIARDLLANEFNITHNRIIDHYIYSIISDGDIMEGVSSEAASLAGHIGLGNLIFIYDYNNITIEGDIDLAFSEDIHKRFSAYNWHIQEINGHDFHEIESALLNAQKESARPSLIIANTIIAKGCPDKEGSESSHGAPLGEKEIIEAKRSLGCDEKSSFCIPNKVYDLFNERNQNLLKEYNEWIKKFDSVVKGEIKDKWDQYFNSQSVESIREKMPQFKAENKIATRSASGIILEYLFSKLPNITGGSADLGPSNKSYVKKFDETGKNRLGRNIHFGVREHAMGAIQNGIAYYGGFVPYTATFLVFLDYMRPAVRLAALSKLKTIYIFTHDSIFVGEDGPTHQPVEHIASARAIPNLTVIRPADAVETGEAWIAALDNQTGPTALILTRQDIPVINRKDIRMVENLHKGAYKIYDDGTTPDVLLLATGSEVSISIDAAIMLKEKGVKASVISFPSWELFEKQPESYQKTILPENVRKRVVVEAGLQMGWEKYAGNEALYITMESFGVSAPSSVLAEEYGFTAHNIYNKVLDYLS